MNNIKNNTYNRVSALKNKLASGEKLKILEAYNGMSTMIVNNAQFKNESEIIEYDGVWISSFTDSASRGLPDVEIMNVCQRLDSIQEVIKVTHKPIIVDGDTGQDISLFQYSCVELARAGVSCVIIEDKKYPKRNSLDHDSVHHLEDPDYFSEKIRKAKEKIHHPDFMIVARIESLIAGYDVDDALNRAVKYIKAGADGIMIHSNRKDTLQVFDFIERYKRLQISGYELKPLICVPTTYNHVPDQELFTRGVNIVIHANHMLRSSHQTMEKVAHEILLNGRSYEVENLCTPVKKIFEQVGYYEFD